MNNTNKNNIFSFLDKKKIKEKQSVEKKIIFWLSMVLVVSTTFFHAFSKETKKTFLTSTSKDIREEIWLKASTAIPALIIFFAIFVMIIPIFCNSYTKIISSSLAIFFSIILFLRNFSFDTWKNLATLSSSAVNLKDVENQYEVIQNMKNYKLPKFILKFQPSISSNNIDWSKFVNAFASNMFDFFSPIVVMVFTHVFLQKEIGYNVFRHSNTFEAYCGEVGTYGTLIYSILNMIGLKMGFRISFFVDISIYLLFFFGCVISLLFFILQTRVQQYKKISGVSTKIVFEKDVLTKLGFKGLLEIIKFIALNKFLRKILINESLFFGLQILTDYYSSGVTKSLANNVNPFDFSSEKINCKRGDFINNNKKIICSSFFFIFESASKEISNKDKISKVFMFNHSEFDEFNQKSNHEISKSFFSKDKEINNNENRDSKFTLHMSTTEYKIEFDIKKILGKELLDTKKMLFNSLSQIGIFGCMEIYKKFLNSYLKNRNLSKKDITFDKFENINFILQSISFVLTFFAVLIEILFSDMQIEKSSKTNIYFYLFMYIYFILLVSLFRFGKYMIMDSMRNNWNSSNLKSEQIRPVKVTSETASSRFIKEIFSLCLKPIDLALKGTDTKNMTNTKTCYFIVYSLLFAGCYFFKTKEKHGKTRKKTR